MLAGWVLAGPSGDASRAKGRLDLWRISCCLPLPLPLASHGTPGSSAHCPASPSYCQGLCVESSSWVWGH